MELILCPALTIYSFVLFARVIMSWVEVFGSVPDALRPVARVLYQLTEPLIGFVRRYVPPVGMLDLSVLIIFMVLVIIQRTLCTGQI